MQDSKNKSLEISRGLRAQPRGACRASVVGLYCNVLSQLKGHSGIIGTLWI